mmetsp:Transcript_74018/g.120164  ORF Transcript_74018/g.120164 Transcript_74018/m.120164 type:complete len:402 (+) Transcript_74018:81-1286(+)
MRTILTAAVVGLAGAAYWYFSQAEDKPKNMGCLESKPDAEAPEAKKPRVETAAPAATNSAKPAKCVAPPAKKEEDKKKALDPKDFMFSNLKGQVCIKAPGEINGQMFIIEDCEDCDIYICDYTAQVQIDYCKNCRIFVGPSESSIFIRNCENCKCIIACQQYRARECIDCDTLLFASTAPVVESSKNMRFGCFRFFYLSLASQFKAVKFSVYDNKWSEVYDFTPTDGNFSFLPSNTKASDLMKPLSAVGASFVSKEEDEAHSDTEVVPLTVGVGSKEFEGKERAFILVLPSAVDEAPQTIFSKLGAGIHLIQTKQLKLTTQKAKQLLQKCTNPAISAAATNGMCVGVEVAGTGALAAAQSAVAAGGGDSKAYVSLDPQAAAYENNLFFEQWRDFAGTSVTK